MISAEARQMLLRDFMLCVENGRIPPLRSYFSDYLVSGAAAEPGDYRLVPLTPPVLRFANTSSDCATDCMLELQSKYQHVMPDDFGGHLEKGSRDIGVIGFNLLDGPVLDILEIQQATCYVEWAEARLEVLDWQQLLVQAVVDFGRSCQATQIRLVKEQDRCARARGFAFDKTLDRFVLDLAAP